MREPGFADWMNPPAEEPGEFEQRWNVAPPQRPMSMSEAFRQAGLPGMEKYDEPTPQELRKMYARSDAERQLPPVSDARVGPDWLYGKAPDPFGGRFQAGKRVQQDLENVGAFGAGMVIPQSLWDIPATIALPLKGVGAAWKMASVAAPHVLEPDEAEAGGLTPRQAMMRRRARAQRMADTVDPATYDEMLPPRTHNQPPPEYRIAPEGQAIADASPADALAAVPTPLTAKQAEQAWMQGLPRAQPAAQATAVPNIRELSVPDAIDIARTQPHLIRAGEQSPGYYVGGPRDIQSKAGLNAQRRDFDRYVAADPRGADWYDRQRGGINLSTGGDPLANDWQSKLHGQFSAGVDPGSELHFVLKENNAAIAGMPVKAARPAQHEAFMRAIAQKDPNQLQLGDKTWEYAEKSNMNQTARNAVGVNDFRYAYQQGFRNPEGGVSKDALTDAQHNWLDQETALAVDRANRVALGGRTDWTGEKIQAAPWVRQKALDIMEERPGITYEQAFQIAMQSVAEHMPKHVYFGTHEVQPGKNSGQMMGSVAAPQAEKDEFFRDRRSTWATAPMGRDAIYSGLGIEDTGVKMRALPTVPMQGYYTNPDGSVEKNLGEIARPLGTFTAPRSYDKEFVGPREKEPFKRATEADQAIMNAGEAFRAYMDAQNAGSWHKLWFGGPVGESNTLFYPRPQGGMGSIADMQAVQGAGTKYGLPDVIDSGAGLTSTRFWPPPENSKELSKALRKGEFGALGLGEPVRAKMDSNLIEYVDEWQKGEGSGAATRKMLSYVTQTPELRAAFNNNPHLAEQAMMKIGRDDDWAKRWGGQRDDIRNARGIVANGKGWIDRMEAALADGSISLPAAAALIGAAYEAQKDAGREGS